jgi:Protein of unknown function (DUF998)
MTEQVVAAQVATRDGFDPTRHAASQLANGDLGWIQIATFLITGAMTIAAAVGVRRAMGPGRLSAWASGLLGAYGVGLVAAGIFRADPSDGFPPGTPPGMGEVSWHGMAHFAVAGIGFACLVAACFVLGAWFARSGQASWAWFPHHGLGVRGQLPRPVVRIGRRRHDFGLHRCGRTGVGLVDRGVGQALPQRGDRVDACVCSRDGQRWIGAPGLG